MASVSDGSPSLPSFSAIDGADDLPEEQSLVNAAIVVVFAYLVPLLTMEINYFRLAAYKSWRRRLRAREARRASASKGAAADGDDGKEEPGLQDAYDSIRRASVQGILSSSAAYSLAAAGVAAGTRGLDAKVVAIIAGASRILAALMVFIVSAKVPQWVSATTTIHSIGSKGGSTAFIPLYLLWSLEVFILHPVGVG